MLSREKPLVKPMAPGSLFHIIESRLHLASFRSIIFHSRRSTTVSPRHSATSFSTMLVFPEEEGMMQQSSVSISLNFENQGINPVGDDAQVTKYLHKQSRTCNQHYKGVVNPFTVTRKSEI